MNPPRIGGCIDLELYLLTQQTAEEWCHTIEEITPLEVSTPLLTVSAYDVPPVQLPRLNAPPAA